MTTVDETTPPVAPVKRVPPPPNPNYDGKQSVLRAPTKKVAAGKVAKPKAPAPPMPKKGVIKESLMPIYGMVGAVVYQRNQVIGKAILENGEACADSLETLAETNDSVRRVLMSLTTTSAWGAVIVAHAPIALAIVSEISKAREQREPEENEETETVNA